MPVAIQSLVPLVQVYDMPRSIAFYRDVLGFEVASTSNPDASSDVCDWCLLRQGRAELMLNTRYESDQRPPESQHVPQQEDVTLYMGCPDVDEAYAYLKSKGCRANVPADAPYGMRQLYVRDPDDLQLCFQHPVKR